MTRTATTSGELSGGSRRVAGLKLKLAQQPLGRVLLHLVCLAQDGKWRWHWAGVWRELRPVELRGR